MEIKKTKNQVEHILLNYPNTRNSDIALTITLWEKFYPNCLIMHEDSYWIALDNLYHVPSQDNIKRLRAHLNAKGQYLPTNQAVAVKRKINAEVWKDYMSRQADQERMPF